MDPVVAGLDIGMYLDTGWPSKTCLSRIQIDTFRNLGLGSWTTNSGYVTCWSLLGYHRFVIDNLGQHSPVNVWDDLATLWYVSHSPVQLCGYSQSFGSCSSLLVTRLCNMSYLVTRWYLHLIAFVTISENVQFLFRQKKETSSYVTFLVDFIKTFISWRCDFHFWHPMRGHRIGEAANPGPSRQEFCTRLCITNPTCIVNKQDYYNQIVQEQGADLFTASETAATHRAQQVFNSQMSRTKFKIIWSAPMEDQFSRSDGEQSLRGKASGTAMISSLPCRAAIDTVDPQWFATGRILHTVVLFGSLHVQLVVLYGLPNTRLNSQQLNSSLILEAIQACSKLPLPYIIAGDFNVDPFSLDCEDYLTRLGLKDLVKLSQEKFGKVMQPTCRDSSIADNALISTDLVPFLRDIWVCPQQYFDTHRPVFVDFAFPSQGVFDTRLKQPKSWIELDLEDELFPDAYEKAVDILGTPSTIEEWGHAVEFTADIVYREQQKKTGSFINRIRGLPKKFRGRCQPATFEQVAVKSLTPVTRPGDYSPPGEIYDFATRKKVLHMRRVQSFLRRYQKQHYLSVRYHQELVAEWDAILRDRSWGTSFLLWCQLQPELGPPQYPLPAFDYVFSLYQLTKHYTDAEVKSNHLHWQQRRQLQQLWDSKQGSSKAFAKMKQNFRPPVSELRLSLSDSVHIAPAEDGLVSVFSGCPQQFSPSNLVYLDDTPCTIKKVDSYSITVLPHADLDLSKDIRQLTQQCVQHAPQEIFGTLNQYWQQFWHQPDNQTDRPFDDDFLQTLLQSVPTLAFPEIQCQDVDLWMQAIRDIKPSAARGVDNVSASELKQLPFRAIQDLAKVMNNYPEGFPTWFCVAKTFLVPKVEGSLSPADVRPISVLPQLYRLWGKVLNTQLFKSLANQIPKQVTGLLQSRGPMDASYEWQYWLEHHALRETPASGFSLDLLKCFNTIDQDQALRILLSLGFPRSILTPWIATIRQLSRVWILGTSCSQPVNCTRGFPEGDAFSVIVMICIGHLWTFAISQLSDRVKASAYADNWGWASMQPRLHAPILDMTTKLVNALGMIIDWKKCWMWGSNKQHLVLLKNALSSYVNPSTIDTVAYAMDLGCNMTYHGPPRLGKLAKRIQSAHQKLERLAKLQFDLKTKILLVKGGVYSSIFWGMELVPFGSQQLQKLRTLISNAILGFSSCRNSALSIAFMPGLLDPAVYVTFRAIVAARRFLTRQNADVRDGFFDRLAKHSGCHHECKGPIGVLKYYLQKFCWQPTRCGEILVTAFVKLHLLHSSRDSILSWLVWTWQQDVVNQFSLRKGHHLCPPVSIDDTVAIIKAFPIASQKFLLEEISGGFQTQHQKAAWDANTTDQCRYCPFPDSRFHRVFQCPATEHVRSQFAEVTEHYLAVDSNVHELPVIMQPPQDEFIRMCHHLHPEAIIDENLLGKLRGLSVLAPVVFFTDGSCQHPSHRSSRVAAYAIVLDVCTSNDQRRDMARQYQLTGSIPDTLKVISVARTTGSQSIYRSELFAILKICEWLENTEIYSDSAAALSAVNRCQLASSSETLCMAAESDLLQRLWPRVQQSNRVFHKIKAHNDPMMTKDLLECYLQLGNLVADSAAVHTARHHFPSLVADLNEHHGFLTTQRNMLKKLYEMHLELSKCRLQLSATLDVAEQSPPTVVVKKNFLHEFCNWVVVDRWNPPVISFNNTKCGAWGMTLSGLLLEWFREIHWPTTATEPDTVGVTWLEMVACFCHWTGFLFPVKRTGLDNRSYLQVAADFDEATLHNIQWSEMAKWFAIFVDQTCDLCSEPIWPTIPRGLVRSLYVLGSPTFSSGLKLRPVLPGQEVVCPILSNHVKRFQKQSYVEIPPLPLRHSASLVAVRRELSDSWDIRSKRAHSGMLEVRRWRKNPQRQLSFFRQPSSQPSP